MRSQTNNQNEQLTIEEKAILSAAVKKAVKQYRKTFEALAKT